MTIYVCYERYACLYRSAIMLFDCLRIEVKENGRNVESGLLYVGESRLLIVVLLTTDEFSTIAILI